MHHLVVRERQHEVLGKGIEQAEGQLVVMMLAVDRLALQILQRVVHEAHVPLEAEAETARVRRLRDAGKGGRFLGDGHDAGVLAIGFVVHALQEGDGLEVFAAAMAIGNPLAVLARVVEIEHRGHRIDAQAVEMIALEPEQRIVDEKARHFLAAKIVDRRVPVRMKALARIFVLIECRAVEAGQPVLIGREMRRNPVEDDADAGAMGRIDEAGKAGRIAEARGRRIEAGWLVAPGRIEGMLGDRQQLDVGEAHVGDIRDEIGGQFVITQEGIAVLALPRTEMHLIDRHGHAARIAMAPRLDIGLVVPHEVAGLGHAGRRLRPDFGVESERIALQRKQPPARIQQFELVALPDGGTWDEDFPDADVHALAHDMAAAVPVIEVADNGDARRIGRPDREMHAVMALVADGVRAELVVEAKVIALGHVVVVERAQHRAEEIGVEHRPGPLPVGGQVAQGLTVLDLDRAFEETCGVAPLEAADGLAVGVDGLDAFRAGNDRPHDPLPAFAVKAEPPEGIIMMACDQRLNLGVIGLPAGFGHTVLLLRLWERSRCRGHIRGSSGRTRTIPYSPY